MTLHQQTNLNTAICRIFLTFEKEDEMDAHFIFGLVLVGFFFWLCFIFRNENKKK